MLGAFADGMPVVSAPRVRVDETPLPAGELVASPVDVLRISATPGVRERWLTALELPIAIWEIAADPARALTVELEPLAGRRVWIQADGGTVERAGAGGSFRVRRSGGAPAVRISMVASHDDSDLARTLDLAGRRGFAGLLAQRAQHARVIAELGAALETPDAAVNRAFEWAKVRADERARSAADASAAAALLAAGLRECARDLRRGGAVPALDVAWSRWVGAPAPPSAPARAARDLAAGSLGRNVEMDAAASPAEFLTGVLGGVWGAVADAARGHLELAPELPPSWDRMGVHRLRVGETVLDAVLRRRPGRLVARFRRRQGPPIVVSFTASGGVESLDLDGVRLAGRTARFELAGDHELTALTAG